MQGQDTGNPPASQKEVVVYGSGRFVIKGTLGAGGMGVVYAAYDRQQDAMVALKTLKNISADGLYLFKNEFRALADLHHPNLVRLGELFCEGDLWFFTMELLQGVDLLAYIRTVAKPDTETEVVTVTPANLDETMSSEMRDTLSLLTRKEVGTVRMPRVRFVEETAEARTVGLGALSRAPSYDEDKLRSSFAQLAAGLSTLHAAGKVHRDVKPSNVMVTLEGRVVLLDFGLVTDTEGDTSMDQVMGTPLYMAPEQPMSATVEPAMDWYSVGVMLYEVLTGKPPFTAANLYDLLKLKKTDPRPPRMLCSAVPADLDKLCQDLLHPDPKDRPSGQEICAQLGAITEANGAASIAVSALASSRGSMPFVGHTRELTELGNALSESRKGKPVAVLVYGESGVGKSTLVNHFLESLDALVLSGRCYEQEFVPYKAFDGIVDALCSHLLSMRLQDVRAIMPREGVLLAKLFPVLGRLPVLAEAAKQLSEEEDPGETRGRAFSALREILSGLSIARPLVIFVDDLQWSDGDSLLLLKDLLQPAGGRYLVVASVRGNQREMMGARGPLHSLHDMERDLRHLSVDRLSTEEARTLVQKLSGATGEEAEALVREAEGHPLFLQELSLYAYRLSGAQGTLARLDDVLAARIRDLDEKVRHVLELVALSGAPIAQRTLARAAMYSPSELSLYVAGLRAAHLVRTQGRLDTDTIEPYHDRIRESVAARLDAKVKKGHHLELAKALEQDGAGETEPQMLVLHFEAAGEDAQAAKHAERAAARARGVLAFDQAAEFIRTALRLGRHETDKRQELLLLLGDVLARAGRGREAAETYLTAAETADVHLRVECRMHAAEHLIAGGYLDRGKELMSGVLREVGEDLPGPRKAMGILIWNRAKLALRGLSYTPVKEGSSPPRERLRWEVYRALYMGLSPIEPAVGAIYHFKSVLWALESGETRCLAEGIPPLVMLLTINGPGAVMECRQMLREAQGLVHASSEEPYFRALLLMAESAIKIWGEGIAGAAEPNAREAELLFKAAASAKPLVTARLLRGTILYMMGEYRELSTWGREIVHDAIRRRDHYGEYTFTHLTANGWLAVDAPDELRKCIDSLLPWTPMEQAYQYQHVQELLSMADLALYTGEAEKALPLFRRHLQCMDLLLKRMPIVIGAAYWAGARLLLSMKKGGSDPVLSEVEAFAKKLKGMGHCITDAQSRIVRAVVAARRGDEETAVRLFLSAERIATMAGMAQVVAAARWRRGEILGGDEGKALVSGAKSALSALGAKRPEQMLAVVVPGLGSGSS